MNNIAIIPARGGSKRIPKKNIKPFLGKPIIAYSIEAAQKSGLFSEIMVSTDSEEIAAIAKEYGATVPFMRSLENADDFATLNDVFCEVRDSYKKAGQEFDNYCVILPTAPLLTAALLREAHEKLNASDFDSVRPLLRFDYPIQRAFSLENGEVLFMQPQYARTRSQDLEPAYHDAGMFYFIRRGSDMAGGKKGGFEIKSLFAQDIDTEEDWLLAEMKYKLINR